VLVVVHAGAKCYRPSALWTQPVQAQTVSNTSPCSLADFQEQ
jgi:hypothetical protein